MIRRRAAAMAIALALPVAGCGAGSGPASPRAVTLALDFQPNAAHSGVYAAVREGLDRRHGVRLRIRVPGSSTDSLKLLGAGRADLSVVDIHDLGLARERGSDVVGVGALVQRPLAAVIARRGVRRPRELEGRRVGVTGLPSDEAVLRSVVEADGGNFERVRRVTIGFSAVPSLVARRVDAVVAFWNVEGVTLRRRGVRTREFRVDEFGAPRYPELVVVAARRTLRERRGLVRKVLATLRDGTRSALGDRETAVSEVARAGGGSPALLRAQLDAVAPALRPPLRLDSRALAAWALFDARFRILRRAPDVSRAFDPSP